MTYIEGLDHAKTYLLLAIDVGGTAVQTNPGSDGH